MIYFLMHENAKLAVINYNGQSIVGIMINPNNKEKLPLLEVSSKSIEDKLIKWIINRGIPVTRQNIKRELTRLDSISVVDYMFDNLGLYLTDHYWFCPENKQYTWQEIRLKTW